MHTISVVVVPVAALGLAIVVFVLGRASVRFHAQRASVIAESSSDYWPVLLKDYYLNALPQATAGYWCGLLLALGAAGLAVWLLLSRNTGLWNLLADAVVGLMAVVLLV